jgi:hypothetical protein
MNRKVALELQFYGTRLRPVLISRANEVPYVDRS